MEMADLDWADLFVYSDQRGSLPQTYRVRVQRDRAFWAKLVPHFRDFWFSNLVPARAALAAHYERHGGTPPPDGDDGDGELGDEDGSAGDVPGGGMTAEESKVALKASRLEEKVRIDKLKEVVRCAALQNFAIWCQSLMLHMGIAFRDYLPSALLPGSATEELEEWARAMLKKSEVLHSS